MSKPAISVVMPVYNGQAYVLDAVASIVEQSFVDWELICINDGSTDQTAEVLDWLATQDRRIRVVHQANTGLVRALNRGFELSEAELIMRMDHDDLALSSRMELQYAYMNRNPDCVVCGGAIMEMDSEGDLLGAAQLPEDHEAIVQNLLTRRTGHFHPSTIIRANAFARTQGYRDEYRHVEDHDLWLRMAQQGRLANIADVLLCYRLHAESICWTRADERRVRMNALLEEAYANLGKSVPEDCLMSHHVQRKPAGPGKWARAAAKRGMQQTARKHISQLWRSSESLPYKIRMSAEVGLRLSGFQLGRVLGKRQEPAISTAPRFPEWQDRWHAAQEKSRRIEGSSLRVA